MEKKAHDEFAASCKPLKELLGSVRNIEGFPIGKDEDILTLSDPPYYTACPNPYLNEFIKKYGKPYDEKTDKYECHPFVGDVSEGKNDPIYNMHSYPTKVPHKAIMKYIEHYTDKGDLVLDGFGGTGMTGIAAQLLNRRAILSDLSPLATFIAGNYNLPADAHKFETAINKILEELIQEHGWMYETVHKAGSLSKVKGLINSVIWSDVLVCPYCSNEYVYWDAAVTDDNDEEGAEILEDYNCPICKASISKTSSQKATVKLFDDLLNSYIVQIKQVPVLIDYSIGSKRYNKKPDKFDHDLISKINEMNIPFWVPTNRMPEGDEARRNDRVGIKHVHHFYTKRNLLVLASLNNKLRDELKFFFTSLLINTSKMSRWGKRTGNVSGTLYIPSLIKELNIFEYAKRKLTGAKGYIKPLKDLAKVKNEKAIISTQSTTALSNVSSNSVDYVFTDPPFGDNLMYSELNFIQEAWLKAFTNNTSEAIVNKSQNKNLGEYKGLMLNCFREYYRIVKPNRWMTVEFHNSRASVWNAIQDAITKAGFIIAQVAVLDKKQGSFKQVTAAGAVKNDLVINAYKPKKRFEENFLKRAGEGLERDFVEEHLNHLPIEITIERTEQMLFSKMIAHYIQHGFEIRLNAKQFYILLRDSFKLIDGYWFTDSQVLKYEQWKKKYGLSAINEIKSGQQVLFVNNERSALVWLYDFLDSPKTYGDIIIGYNKITTNVEDKMPEPKELLETNFIFENGKYRRPRTEKEQELIEEQREKDLGKAFERILAEAKTTGKKIKEVRKEAVAHGFTMAYQEKRFADIIAVAKKLDKKILEENSEINDFVEVAQLKLGVEL